MLYQFKSARTFNLGSYLAPGNHCILFAMSNVEYNFHFGVPISHKSRKGDGIE